MTQQLSPTMPLQGVLPSTATVNERGHLAIGGCDTVELAREYGTPLYVFDEQLLRDQARAFVGSFTRHNPDTMVAYASKAYIGLAVLKVMQEEGLGLDVVSGGELAIALAAGFPPERIHLHGNNKTPQELREAVAAGIGRVVVDNFYEIEVLDRIAGEAGRNQSVLLRLAPGIDPHTHAKISTGQIDTKFGFTIENGDAAEAVNRTLAANHLTLLGYHCHIGSQIFEIESYEQVADVMLGFAAAQRDRTGYIPTEFSPGGGFAVQYLADAPPPEPDAYAAIVVNAVSAARERYGLPPLRLFVEPGRSMVARAGVALYTVGSIKDIPGVRRYVSIDGGMADNIRPAMYDARYEAIIANRPQESPDATVTIAGKYCESGDILIRDIDLPELRSGDVLAVPASGAYAPAMASNYNGALRPAVVFVRDGAARLVRRRETYEDLLRTELA
ncbi:MAG: diaminopimelate decarboxylase [Dehalococcoidia bacterium]